MTPTQHLLHYILSIFITYLVINKRIIHILFHITASISLRLQYLPEGQRDDIGRGLKQAMVWKNVYFIIFKINFFKALPSI